MRSAATAPQRPGRYTHMGRLGWEEIKTYFRQGVAEIRAVFYGESRIAQPPDPGMYGVVSHGEAADIRREVQFNMQGREPESILEKQDRARAVDRSQGPTPVAPQPDRDTREIDQTRDTQRDTGPDLDRE